MSVISVVDVFNVIIFLPAADQSKIMQEQMSGAAMAMPPDPKAAFKAEWEALEITEHKWALATVEADLVATQPVPAWIFIILGWM